MQSTGENVSSSKETMETEIIFDIYKELEFSLKAKAIIRDGYLIKIKLIFNAGKKDLYHFINDAADTFSELHPEVKIL